MREPKVGEVWTHRDRADELFLIEAIHRGRVAGILRNPDVDVLTTLEGDLLHTFYDPPAEPWKNPQWVEAWAVVDRLGLIVAVVSSRPPLMSGDWPPRSAHGEIAAICRVRCEPIPGTVEKVE